MGEVVSRSPWWFTGRGDENAPLLTRVSHAQLPDGWEDDPKQLFDSTVHYLWADAKREASDGGHHYPRDIGELKDFADAVVWMVRILDALADMEDLPAQDVAQLAETLAGMRMKPKVETLCLHFNDDQNGEWERLSAEIDERDRPTRAAVAVTRPNGAKIMVQGASARRKQFPNAGQGTIQQSQVLPEMVRNPRSGLLMTEGLINVAYLPDCHPIDPARLVMHVEPPDITAVEYIARELWLAIQKRQRFLRCPICHLTFVLSRGWQTYCTTRCANKAGQERRKKNQN